MIIVDIISERIPSVEIYNWVLKYKEISDCNNLSLDALSGFLISVNDLEKDTRWFEIIQNNIQTEIIYPPILRFKLDKTNLASETSVHRLVK